MTIKLKRICCFILTICMITSLCISTALPIFAETEETTPTTQPTVVLNRNFQEGWDFNNGLSDARKGNNYFIDNEITDDFSYNYFLRYEAQNGEDGFTEIRFSGAPFGRKHAIIELDIKLDDYCDLGSIMYTRTVGGMAGGITTTILGIKKNNLIVLENEGSPIPIDNTWCHVAIDYDYSNEEDLKNNTFAIRVYVTPKGGETQVFETLPSGGNTEAMYLDIARLGIVRNPNPEQRIGTSYCIDNLQAYCTDDGFYEIPDDVFGTAVNTSAMKNIPIKTGGAGGMSDKQYIENGLCMKVGVNYALYKNERKAIYDGTYGAPVKKDGIVYVPIEIVLNYIGYPYYVHPDGESFDISTGKSASYITVGRDTAVVDGKKINLEAAPAYAKSKDEKNSYLVIAMNDIEKLFPGYYLTYDDMGLILIAQKDEVLNRDKNLFDMLDLMADFIFDFKTPEEFSTMLETNTNNFTHPYLIANEDTYEKLRSVYNATEGDENYNAEVKDYLDRLVRTGDKRYRKYALPTGQVEDKPVFEKYLGLNPENKPINPYPDTNGYDPHGGRLNESANTTREILDIAFAYVITKDERYLKCAYDLCIAMGEWEHWGPGHFLNCADASYPFAVVIDLCYNGWVDLVNNGESKYDVAKTIDILYTHGTYQGYYSSVLTRGQVLFPRNGGQVANYAHMENNWNAVCTSGMVTAALITAEVPEYREVSMILATSNIETLMREGMSQYAPDGAYVESPGYWSYGTNSLYKMLMALESSIGSDLGIFNCWGLETTCYFACHSETSDYRYFNYHDSGLGIQDTSMFFYVAKATGDNTLAAIRKGHLDGGKTVTIYDVIFFPFGENLESADLPLSYVSEGIDLFTVRSSWEKGSMFAGIIGGDNACSHGQVDSGTWTYHNFGKVFIRDLGSDQYNVYQYFSGTTRYRYYKMNAEGNNDLCIVGRENEMPFGQKLDAIGEIVEQGSNEHGAYAVIDNTDVYNGRVTYARRGMLSTNDNKTVVIQDEVSCKGIESFYWFAHYSLDKCNARLSKDRRTAYLEDPEGNIVRLSIVSKTKEFKFEIMDCYTFVLGGDLGTVDKDFSPNHGGVVEHDRHLFMKLAIKAENVLSVNLAVAVEAIDKTNEEKVGYEWSEMKDWVPTSDIRDEGESEVIAKRQTPKLSDIKSGVRKIEAIRDKNKIYTDDLDRYYRAICDSEYAFLVFKDDISDSLLSDLKKKNEFVKEYDAFVEGVNGIRTQNLDSINNFMGI